MKNLTGLLEKIGKLKIRHGGFLIEVKRSSEKVSIKLTEEKAVKVERKALGRKRHQRKAA